MFNLKKNSQTNPQGGSELLLDGLEETNQDLTSQINAPLTGQQPSDNNPQSIDQISENFSPEQIEAAKTIASAQLATRMLSEINQSPDAEQIKNYLMTQSALWQKIQNSTSNTALLNKITQELNATGLPEQVIRTNEFLEMENRIRREYRQAELNIQRLKSQQLQQRQINLQRAAFNLKRSKISQVVPLQKNDKKDSFVNEYASVLLGFKGDKGEHDQKSELARDRILQSVSPAAQEEVNDVIRSIQILPTDVGFEEAKELLEYIYDNWIAPGHTQDMERRIMSNQQPKGIIKHDLSDLVLNNKGIAKTAANHFGDPYFLYGPTEKRICPKLRGKGGGQPGSGDVVSEYICRHHCLDGIVIDDNKTICGEALWRSHVMDKFSREYVDSDGNITGGYIEKRFDVHHDVPEENNMRLKPGETRKPRPPEWGSLESRMQAMRAKEGEKRGYRPETNTGDPFNWCKDVDQNNVEVTQSERDRREEASGHKLVQYTNKDEQENEPKLAFNLSKVKTAQYSKFPYNEHTMRKKRDSLMSEVFAPKDSADTQIHSDPQTNNGWMDDLSQLGGDSQYPCSYFGVPADKQREQPEVLTHIAKAWIRQDESGFEVYIKGYGDLSTRFDSLKEAKDVASEWVDMHSKSAFNLSKVKTAQINSFRPDVKPLPMGDLSYEGLSDGGEPYTDEELDIMERPDDWHEKIQQWSQENLDQVGNYIGPDLSTFGFNYNPGEFIPVDKRYSTMLEWEHANKVKNMSQPKPMTGPRGPIGEDNPSSDDLGLSPDMHEKIDDDFIPDNEISQEAEEIVSLILEAESPDQIISILNQLSHTHGITQFDVDEITDEANKRLKSLGKTKMVALNDKNKTFYLKEDDIFSSAFASRKTVFNLKLAKKKKFEYKGKKYKTNPFAVCNTTVDKDSDPEKYERCVKKVKQKSKVAQLGNIPLPEDGRPIEPKNERIRKPFPANGNDFEREKFDFNRAKERISKMTDEALQYTLKDIEETIRIQEKANREGHQTPKLGYYYDERLAVLTEIQKRKNSSGLGQNLDIKAKSKFNLKEAQLKKKS